MAVSKDITLLRKTRILDVIKDRAVTNVKELAQKVGERQDTVERDVKYLMQQDPFIHITEDKRVILLPFYPRDTGFIKRLSISVAEKEAIANYVVDNLIQSNDRILLDGSTTSFFIAKQLYSRGCHSLTIFVNNTFFLNLLTHTVNDVLFISGQLSRESALTTPTSTSGLEIEKYDIRKAFLGFDGLSYPTGIFGSRLWSPLFRSILHHTSDFIYLIGDHTKIGKTPRQKVIGFDEVEDLTSDYLVITTTPNEGDQQEARLRQEFNEAVEKFPDGKVKVLPLEGNQ